ncbi:hypothetical protein [Rhizobium leguminosarum]|uniref:Lipoprotein n=1 Tax=Rhizobium leguminosarum TaxID=384 RepID=A0A7K3VRR7_RHILE|nr:hypothetical protein [Rhizobium leguminosarum]NEK19890.1 hypothetical protein [Rhizobium leguminosarum]
MFKTNLVISISALVAAAGLATGCGIGGFCTNDCPSGQVHGSVDCGCMEKITSKEPDDNSDAKDKQPDQSHYIVRRYYCVGSNDGSDQGTCDVTGRGESCVAALGDVRTKLSAVQDPCRSCDRSVTERTKKWSGNHEDIQGGPCQDWSSHQQIPALLSATFEYGRSAGVIAANALYSKIPDGQSLVGLLRNISDTPSDNSPATCKRLCEQGNTAFCYSADIDASKTEGMERLQAVLMSTTSVIKADSLKAMFGIKDDPCSRGDTTLVDGTMTNIGGECSLEAHTDETDIAIAIPELLRATAALTDKSAIFLFDEPQTRAKLNLSDPGLQRDWGGDIVSVLSEPGSVLFSVGKEACLRVKLSGG